MSCLYCLTAHQRGRFWVCKRCGDVMFACPAPGDAQPYALQRRPIVYRRNAEGQAPDEQDRDGRHPYVPRDAASPQAAVPDAVVLDLDAARRIKERRTC
jgi:hypothetical protein